MRINKSWIVLFLFLIVLPLTQAAVDDADTMSPIAVIIALPMVLGIFFIVGAATLSDDHNVLKIFLFLLSIITFFVSMGLGLTTVIKYFDFEEMQDMISSTIYWFGVLFGVIITYFIIYLFYKMIHSIHQKEKEELEY
jgi:hypothetical protein